MYKLFIKRSAERDLRKLPKNTLRQINRKILILKTNPRPSGVRKLTGALEGWRIQAGDYRIVYQIDDSAQAVTIVRVKHRREVYR